MPCTYYESTEEIIEREIENNSKLINQAIKPYRDELDKVTALLCKLCKRLDSHITDDQLKKELTKGGIKSWWEDHKIQDKQRKKSDAKPKTKK